MFEGRDRRPGRCGVCTVHLGGRGGVRGLKQVHDFGVQGPVLALALFHEPCVQVIRDAERETDHCANLAP